jgi:hypothetical protein
MQPAIAWNSQRRLADCFTSNPVATEYQKNRAKELLGSSADKLDELIAAFDKKPTVPVDSTPASPKVPEAEPEPPKLTDEELAKRYQQALEQRAREYRAEMDKTQREYEREWWRGWER